MNKFLKNGLFNFLI